MEFRNLFLETPDSKVRNYLLFKYSKFKDFRQFISKVYLKSDLRNTKINSSDIAYFSSPEIYSNCNNIIWNINPQNKLGHYPNRIYAIFVMGYQENIKKLNSCYLNILNLLDDPFHSNLGSTDCCKMLYIHAKKFNNLDVKSVPDILGDIYRGTSPGDFINYYRNNNVNVESIQNLL